MPVSSLETVNQLFSTLKAHPEVEASDLCEQVIELFPTLLKEEQNNFSVNFYKWAEKWKIKYPLIFCYARLIMLADHFFCEKHEIVLSEGSVLQEAFLKNNEPAPAAAIGNEFTFRSIFNQTIMASDANCERTTGIISNAAATNDP